MGSAMFAVDNYTALVGRKLRQVLSVFLPVASSTRPLGSVSGIRRNAPPALAVSSTTWSIGAHAGVLDVEVAAIAGPYEYAFDSAQTGSVTAAVAFTRLDLVSVHVTDPTEDGTTGSPSVAMVYTQGTVANVQPATPAGSMPVALITVPASGGGSPSIQLIAPTLPGNDLYNATLNGNSSVTTASTPVTLTNVLTLPALGYPTLVEVDCGAVVTTQVTTTDIIELELLVNGSITRGWRGTGVGFTLDGGYRFLVPANTVTTLQAQAQKAGGSSNNATTMPVDTLRRWLQAVVVPN